jgi:hypothetical protein
MDVGRDYVGDGRHCAATSGERKPAAVSKTVLSLSLSLTGDLSLLRGTEGSNPSPSSEESVANPTTMPDRRHLTPGSRLGGSGSLVAE